jgi:hypothetical protein
MEEIMKRPELNDKLTVNTFKNFYWLKKELIAFCKIHGISQVGGKREIAERISTFLQSGEVINHKEEKKTSNFNWHQSRLSLDTIITDNYKNTRNVRLFFTEQIGSHFRVHVPFIEWMRTHVGKTMKDAIDEWHKFDELRKNTNYQTEIAPQFEYNRYIRDFLADNPGKSTKEAIRFWKLKRSKAGSPTYSKMDLQLTED